MKKSVMNDIGFTLVELMITLAVFGIVMTGVYSAYQAQIRSHFTQQQIMDMQQNLRAALYLMEREIRMAGLNPTDAAGIGINVADAHTLSFSMDYTGGLNDGIDNDGDGIVDEGVNGVDDNASGLVDDNGNPLADEVDEQEWYDGDDNDPNEQVVYMLSNDADSDGMNDGLPTETNDGSACNLMRNGELLAMNIDALNFVYLDSAGDPLATPVADPSDIRSIQVSLVARSGDRPSKNSYDYVDQKTYTYKDKDGNEITILPQQNDSFRRISMTMEAKCRNMGL